MDPTRRRIRKIDKDAQRFVAQALGNTNLSLSDYDMIHTVNRRPGITQEELRKKYCLDKSTIARRAAKLEAEGYICSVPGKGSFVAARSEADSLRITELLGKFDELVTELSYVGVTGSMLIDRLKGEQHHD